jgi:hypothetical protein
MLGMPIRKILHWYRIDRSQWFLQRRILVLVWFN